MKYSKNKGLGYIYGFVVILFHAVGHWMTEQYRYDAGFHDFVINLKSTIFSYFNSSIPLKVTIGLTAFMLLMSIVSTFWKYSD